MAEVEVDARGNYQDHRVVQPGFICLNCGSPALDLGEVPAEIEAENEADALPQVIEVLCPMCETRVEVGDEMECPNCGAPLEAL
jgi:DNA-directed RNA polymerase subunit RPC12/RpoP